MEKQNEDIIDAIDSMSVDNILFANSGIRCTVLPHERNYSTNLLSVPKPWVTASNCRMKIYYSVTHVLENAYIQICIHGLTFSACQNCKGTRQLLVEVTSFWILDFRALFYFTGEKRDFITFEKLLVPFPIYIANSSTHITEKGVVVLRHLNKKNSIIIITLLSLFFCKDLTCCLLSLGAFLQDGLTVSGNKGIISINTKSSKKYMTFKPRSSIDTIYVLQTLDWI